MNVGTRTRLSEPRVEGVSLGSERPAQGILASESGALSTLAPFVLGVDLSSHATKAAQ